MGFHVGITAGEKEIWGCSLGSSFPAVARAGPSRVFGPIWEKSCPTAELPGPRTLKVCVVVPAWRSRALQPHVFLQSWVRLPLCLCTHQGPAPQTPLWDPSSKALSDRLQQGRSPLPWLCYSGKSLGRPSALCERSGNIAVAPSLGTDKPLTPTSPRSPSTG